MRVGIDLDGVVLDFQAAFQAKYVDWFGFPTAGEWKTWDDPLSKSHFENYDDLFDWCARAGVFENMPWVPGAPAGIEWILDRHQVAFLTSRSAIPAQRARDWLAGTPWHSRALLYTGLGDHKEQVNCSVYIDDSPHVLKNLREAGKVTIKFKRPWNTRTKTDFDAENWLEVVEILEELGS